MLHFRFIRTAILGLSVAWPGFATRPAPAFDLATGAVAAPDPDRIKQFRSRMVKIDFELRTGREGLSAVELWYTPDQTATWTKADIPGARSSPIIWTAPQDGLFGLYLIVSNSAGASSPPPTAGTAPHQWVRVDSSPPQVRVLGIDKDARFNLNRRVDVRWSAPSSGLAPRPIDIYYRKSGDDIFNLIATSLPNDGRFRWTVPDDLAGTLTLKVVARERAGQPIEAFSQPIEIARPDAARSPDARPAADHAAIERPAPQPPAIDAGRARANTPPLPDVLEPPAATPEIELHESPVANPIPGTADSRLSRAEWHRERGEWKLAEERYREALQADPTLRDARRGLAAVLAKQKNLGDAEVEYGRLLAESPDDVEALRGLAMVQVARRRYASAARTLDELLRLRGDDAEAWMTSGDVAMLMGDRVAARRAWKKAEALADGSGDLAERARKRLIIYPADQQP
jgi:tetratricopeptide (TPR) repeat protein